MEKKIQYALFNPNYTSSKNDQIKLKKYINTKKDEKVSHLSTPTKLHDWRIENKAVKEYIPQESKYNFKQIIKNFKLNKEQLSNGFSNKYMDIFTDLLFKSKKKPYSKKRLCLIDFRKKILKHHKNTSFEVYIKEEPLSEKFDFSKQSMNNIYLSDKSYYKLKYKSYFNTPKKDFYKNIGNIKDKILTTELSKEKILNDNTSKSKLNIESEGDEGIENYNNRRKNRNNFNNLYNPIFYNTPFTKSYNNLNSNEIKIINKNNEKKKIVEKDYFESNFFGKINPKEEFFEKRNKPKYIDYLKNKYHFYLNNKELDDKNYTEIKKRQLNYFNGKNKVKHPLEYPFKKEFFKKLNRFKNKDDINKDKPNNKIKITDFFRDIKSIN